MKNLLKKLVDIDKEAQAIDEELKKEKDNLEVDIQKEVESTHQKYMKDAQQTIDGQVELIREEAEAQWKINCEKYDIAKVNLEKEFNEKFDNWVDSIVADVLA